MTKTKFNTLLVTTAVLVLAACGGSGDGTATNPTQPPPTEADKLKVNTRNHISGKKVFMGNEIDDGVVRRYVSIVDSEEILDFIYTGDENRAVNVTRDSFFANNLYGVFREIHFTVGGNSYKSIIYVDEQSSESVTAIGTFVDTQPNIVTEGARLTSVPTGQFEYRGGLIQSNSVNSFNSGSFSLLADFAAATVDFTANTAVHNISASEVPINLSSGTFSSNSLNIRSDILISNPSYSGQIDGTFTGKDASGVVGVYSTTGGELIGGFAGVR